MWLRVFFVLLISSFVFGRKSICSHEAAIVGVRRPSYEFSIALLDRVTWETSDHFVFSPLSTWFQLTTLAEGARGNTLQEISKVTRHIRIMCNRRRLKKALNQMNNEYPLMSTRKSFMIIDKAFDVKSKFKKEAEIEDLTKVLLLDFNNPSESADIANEVISLSTNDTINEIIGPDDFNDTTLLMVDTAYFKSNWKYPFSPAYTEPAPFYSEENIHIGYVNLMSQTGYFNMTSLPHINVEVLELSCDEQDRISMLIFLPTSGKTISDMFYSLRQIHLKTIINKFKSSGTKLIKVMLPRFKITTEIDSLPQLIYDMGVTSIFYPDKANFDGISDYRLYASIMTQVADIEVTEKGVSTLIADFMIAGDDAKEFKVNKPFGFILIDKRAEVLLYAGAYSNPSLF